MQDRETVRLPCRHRQAEGASTGTDSSRPKCSLSGNGTVSTEASPDRATISSSESHLQTGRSDKAFFYSDYYNRLMREMSDRGVEATEAGVAYHGRVNSNTVKVS